MAIVDGKCDACACSEQQCVCKAVDEFFNEPGVRELMDKLAEHDQATPEEREAFVKAQPGAKQCLACFFYHCRCTVGLQRKRL
jgi:hypothetical protein